MVQVLSDEFRLTLSVRELFLISLEIILEPSSNPYSLLRSWPDLNAISVRFQYGCAPFVYDWSKR